MFVLELASDQKDDYLRQEVGGNCRVEPMLYIGNYLQFLKLVLNSGLSLWDGKNRGTYLFSQTVDGRTLKSGTPNSKVEHFQTFSFNKLASKPLVILNRPLKFNVLIITKSL